MQKIMVALILEAEERRKMSSFFQSAISVKESKLKIIYIDLKICFIYQRMPDYYPVMIKRLRQMGRAMARIYSRLKLKKR